MTKEQKEKIKAFFKDDANLFVISLVLLYGGWKIIHYFLLKGSPALTHGWKSITNSLGEVYAIATSFLLNIIFREHTIHRGIGIIYPEKSKFITVEEHCLAIPATIIFVGCILLFKGKWKNKLWFIPMGISFIILINLIRLMFVCETFVHFQYTIFKINHSLVYVIITYALIMTLIIWWMRSFGKTKTIRTDLGQIA